MTLSAEFIAWQPSHRANQSTALAWFLANALCQRFYASHGYVPWILAKEGLGFYGIGIYQLPCAVQSSKPVALGRLTSCGDVENWANASDASHRLDTINMCARGDSLDALVSQTINYLGLRAMPEKSHVSCRHKRWGASYCLLFEIATRLAITYGDDVRINNDPDLLKRFVNDNDPQAQQHEHPGVFLLQANHDLLIRGDGKILLGASGNLWQRFMAGSSSQSLANELAITLGLAT